MNNVSTSIATAIGDDFAITTIRVGAVTCSAEVVQMSQGLPAQYIAVPDLHNGALYRALCAENVDIGQINDSIRDETTYQAVRKQMLSPSAAGFSEGDAPRFCHGCAGNDLNQLAA